MDKEKIVNKIIKLYTPLTADCKQEFIASSKIKTFEKGTIVIREGQYSKKAYLVVQGPTI